jgi:hypothetical protein
LQTISNSSACENVRTVAAKIDDFDGLGMRRVYFCKRFQIAQLAKITVSAKINDSDGLGMGRVYVCTRFQIAQLVKI